MVQEDNLYALATRSPRSPRSVRSRSPSPPKYSTGIVAKGKATRTVEILNEGGTECITISAAADTKTTEVCEILSAFCSIDADKIRLIKQVGSYSRQQSIFDEVAGRVTALGVPTFRRPIMKYEHPAVVIGAGLGGIQTMMKLLERGRTDFICLEKLHDFGGHSWMVVANKFTKLQTEKGTYYSDYITPGVNPPTQYGDQSYPTWPSRDQLLRMFREDAKAKGLYDYTRFHTSVSKVRPLPGKFKYSVATVPEDRPDEGGELIVASSVFAWPGNLCKCNPIEFAGEDEFGGYIEYASFSKMDYTKVAGKETILYGHGAFTIENVRTLLEHRAKKVYVLCRKRNLCGMKVVSWMVAHCEVPMPGVVILEAFQKMYDLVGFDVWTAHSVKTDANRTFAHISQKTVFGVTDVYFLAGYYGLMEVVVDEIKRLTHLCAHTKRGRKLEVQVIVKAVGTVPDFAKDKMLGLKELHGLWVNGDPMRPVVCNAMYVEARNFGSFSSGPGFASSLPAILWFVDYPADWEVIRGKLPINRAGERPAYVPAGTHLTPTFATLGALLPMLAAAMGQMDVMKFTKQRAAHPPAQYLAECRAEWELYIRMWKKWGMIDDRPEPAYPYTEAIVEDWVERSTQLWVMRGQR